MERENAEGTLEWIPLERLIRSSRKCCEPLGPSLFPLAEEWAKQCERMRGDVCASVSAPESAQDACTPPPVTTKQNKCSQELT